jgi:bacterioferritin-associated ferredoxin
MIVCVCRRVSDQQIRQAVAEGAESFEELQLELGVATQCGRCADCVCAVLTEAQTLQRAARSAASAVLPVAEREAETV